MTIQGGSADSPDFLWYNADIVNNNQLDAVDGIAVQDPQVRFNETRDKPILYNIQDYHFSIIRFSMNGANLDLPLWCPQVELGSARYDPDANTVPTVYSFTLSYQQQWNLQISGSSVKTLITAISPQQFLLWVPQVNNTVIGPPPLPGTITKQDLSSRFWWATDYSYVVSLMNTALETAWVNVWGAFNSAWTATGTTSTNPYTTFASFMNGVGVFPQLIWNAGNTQSHTISLYADSDCFGQRLTSFTPASGTTVGPTSTPYCRIFTNNNMYGLLSGFSSLYWNTDPVPPPPFQSFIPGTPNPSLTGSTWTISGSALNLSNIDGATNELIVTNAFYANVQDYRLTPYAGTPPLGFVPTSSSSSGINLQKVYWAIAQDFACVDTMWSPIASLVFTSQFIPVTKEIQSDPTFLGYGNLGTSGVTSPSAFQPIVGDLEIDLADKGADAYRGFIKYEPQAEFRMSDISGQNDLRSIDIQLWWKGRLDGVLYPVNMFNLSSVSIKMLFRKKGITSGKSSHL
jgi:hypothetical protein